MNHAIVIQIAINRLATFRTTESDQNYYTSFFT